MASLTSSLSLSFSMSVCLNMSVPEIPFSCFIKMYQQRNKCLSLGFKCQLEFYYMSHCLNLTTICHIV